MRKLFIAVFAFLIVVGGVMHITADAKTTSSTIIAQPQAMTPVISAGNHFTCAINNWNGSYCWGYNQYGQLGTLPSKQNQTVPVAVTMPNGMSFTTITTGTMHSCAISSTGNAYCWGLNSNKQLGNGTTTDSTIPTPVTMPVGVTFTDISAGEYHTCAVANTGVVYCWGYQLYGRLGVGATSGDIGVPTAVTMPDGVMFTHVSAAHENTCAVTSSSAAYCWGANFYGQVGSAGQNDIPILITRLPDGVTVNAINAGFSNICALANTNDIYCWGFSGGGIFGNGTTGSVSTPTKVTVPNGVTFNQLSVGEDFACALSTAGNAYCWGAGTLGQLGNNTTNNSVVPVAVTMPNSVTFTRIDAGQTHTCALAGLTGTIYCWGQNSYGALGNGTTNNSLIPVAAMQNFLVTPTFTASATYTRTATKTSTPTKTSTGTKTSTPTKTSTSTKTNTPTKTSTRSHTRTRTNTPTRSNTSTRTNTPTATNTSTPSNTRTPAASNTFTFTAQPFLVSSFQWYIGLTPNKTLNLTRNTTYKFIASFNSSHILVLKQRVGTLELSYGGANGFPLTTGNEAVFNLPSNAPATLWYVCTNHPTNMRGQINVTGP